MKNTNAIELLPWLINRSLAPEEEARLREELRNSQSLRQELAETFDAARSMGGPPPVRDVVDYASGRPIADPERMALYLEVAPEAGEEVELVERSFALRDESIALLGARRSPRLGGWRSAAIAAALAAVVGLGGWIETWQRAEQAETKLATVERLQRGAASLGAPELNVTVLDLVATSFLERGGGVESVHVVHLSELGDLVNLILTSDSKLTFDTYELDLVDPEGEALWTGAGLERTEQRDYTLLVPKSWLREGAHRIDVYGRDGSERTLLESYSLSVEP